MNGEPCDMLAAGVCFHCGQPIPKGVDLSVLIDGELRPMCCIGCHAVAQAIVDGGLADYYRHRDALPDSPREAMPEALKDIGLFDHAEIKKSFVRELADSDEQEADLILEGITCAACIWLNEQQLSRLPGVTSVQVNYTTRRARVRWRGPQIKLSEILAAVSAIGYRAYPFDPHQAEDAARRERRLALWRLFVAGFGMMQVMMYAYPAYIADEGEMSPEAAGIMRWASLVLTLPVVFYAAAPFFQRAWRDARLRRLGMDIPVAIGIGSAFVASVWATLVRGGEVYFDSVTMFVFFLLAGRYLELLARQRAVRNAEEIGRAMPLFARRIDEAGHDERIVLNALKAGDRLRVLPGETIVADGLVLEGESSVDQSWLTGESRAIGKSGGDEVLAGSINGGSPLVIRADRIGEATRLAGIRSLMERASSERPRIVEQADRVAAYFVGALLIIAAATGLMWWQIDPSRALWICVSVLVVSCPCALSLATPVALTVATDALSRIGLLATRSHAIESLARAQHFVFDKTGTLTTGHLSLMGVRTSNTVSRDEVIRPAAALERQSEHPIATAIVAAAPSEIAVAQNVRAVSGEGMCGVIDGQRYAIGRARFVDQFARVAMPNEFAMSTDTEIFLVREGEWLAAFDVHDSLRPQAADLVSALRADGCKVSIFSGDAMGAVQKVAHALGVEDARHAMTPEEKHSALKSLQQAGAIVAMVGDGINDAPVLAQAHVSIAMANGPELARHQGDFLLLGDDLMHIARGRNIARQTVAITHQNLIWAASYNFLSIPAAIAGWVTPWLAGIGMGASSLFVVLNALRIGRRKP